jgi:hypothetical protein
MRAFAGMTDGVRNVWVRGGERDDAPDCLRPYDDEQPVENGEASVAHMSQATSGRLLAMVPHVAALMRATGNYNRAAGHAI